MLTKATVHITKDGEEFKTFQNMEGINARDYDLGVLVQAEQRVKNGRNKTMQTALNSIAHLKRGNPKAKSPKVDIRNLEFDEYGLSEDVYSPQQIKFIKERIQDFYDNNNISSSYQKQGVIRMAKLENTITELEALNALSRGMDKDLMSNLKAAQDMYAKLSNDMKLTPRQASDGEKGEDAFANAVIAYDEKFRFETFDFEDIEKKDMLMNLMIDHSDRIMELMNDSKTFFHFKKALSDTLDLKPNDINEIGYFTLEEIFDFRKVAQDRKIIKEKNELTRDANYVDREMIEMGDGER